MKGLLAVFDNHFHLRQDGLFLEAVRRFQKEGGTCINLTNLPNYALPAEGYYTRIYEETIQMAKIIRRSTPVKVIVTLGPYPLDYFFFRDSGMDPLGKMQNGLEVLRPYLQSGEAVAIGEVGRPHFQVSEKEYEDGTRIIQESMVLARDEGCPVVLHTEDLKCGDLEKLGDAARRIGLRQEMVVKHHSDPENLSCNVRILHSILATRTNVRKASESARDFLLESDYVDDPLKPGKVIAPESVPRRAKMIMQENDDWERILHASFVDLPGKLYGIERIA